MSADKNNLIWLDLEMTGLDTMHDRIIEIATIITDKSLNILSEGPQLAIHHSQEVLNGMDAWNQTQHKQSGLVEEVLQSQLDYAEAEQRTLDFLKNYVHAGQSPMCGSGICQDRRFLARLMPELEAFFHYRNLDVSTVRTLVQYWCPEHINKQATPHRAQDDLRNIIAELKHYQSRVFHFIPPCPV